MSAITPSLQLPLLDAAQAQKHVTHNEAVLMLDTLAQIAVIDRRSAPPASPTVGDRYLVLAPTSGLFLGNERAIATYEAGGWRFFPPSLGWQVFIKAERRVMIYDGAQWIDAPMRASDMLGVNATADSYNRLVVSSPSILFNHAGDSMQMKINKANANHTASQLYQTDWSGRAEVGLIGDDHFHIKVSPDGATWREAALFNAATGTATFPQGIAAGDRMGFRNLLRNAAFAINQRGVSGTVTLAAGAYGHDGVKGGSGGATYTFSTSGNLTTLSISAGSVILPIEASMVDGGVHTLSQAGTAQARVWQGPGHAGSGVYAAAPFSTSSLNAVAQTNVEFSTGTVLRPQLEAGAVLTQFERRPSSVEWVLCRYYFQRFSDIAYKAIGSWFNSTSAVLYGAFPAMRTAPTATLGTLIVDAYGIGNSTPSAYNVYPTPTSITIMCGGLSPAAVAFVPAGLLSTVDLSAEI